MSLLQRRRWKAGAPQQVRTYCSATGRPSVQIRSGAGALRALRRGCEAVRNPRCVGDGGYLGLGAGLQVDCIDDRRVALVAPYISPCVYTMAPIGFGPEP